ncbi:MAG TPA: efflux RND transporter periplasmic adaptor subunit [Polyangiaceae bacterium]|nr:efflux RND transporter periplasmic adaptor subunit [Polyangiaceae bacterium]
MLESSPPIPLPSELGPLGQTVPEPVREQRQRRRRGARRVRRVVGASTLGGCVVLGAWALRPEPIHVDVAKAAVAPLTVAIEESGRTRVKDRYAVSAPTTGRLSRIWLQPGDTVKEGDTLAEISPSPSPLIDQRTRAEAEARLGAARSAQGQAQVRLARAATERERAERELERSRKLGAAGALSPREVELAQFEARLQAEEVASSEFAVKVAGEEVRLASAALQRQEGGQERYHIDVLAPTSGRVLRVLQESAGLVQAGTPLVEVGDPAALEIVVDLLTTDAVHVTPGTPALIVGWGGDHDLNARVSRIEPSGFTHLSALGVEEQRVNVVLAFTDPASAWSALGDGFHIEARIVLWRGEQVLQVPALAVFRQGGGSAVFGLEGDRARLVPLTLGHRGDAQLEVTAGLEPGDTVIVHPGDRVKDGARVKALP